MTRKAHPRHPLAGHWTPTVEITLQASSTASAVSPEPYQQPPASVTVTNVYSPPAVVVAGGFTPAVDRITGRVVAGGRGRHAFYLEADGVQDWALITRDRRRDNIFSIGEEDRIGVLGTPSVFVSGKRGRLEIQDHKRQVVGMIRDPDISLAEAREMVCALPQGWPV